MRKIRNKDVSNINFQTAFNLIALVLVNGFSFLVTPIISNMVGTEGYGICSIFVTYVNIFSIVCGIKMSSSLNTARIKFKGHFDEYASSTLLLSLITSIAFVLITIFLINPISQFVDIESRYTALIAVNGVASYIIVFMTGYQLNKKEAQKNLLLSFSVILFTTILSVLLIKLFDGHYSGRIYGLVIPNVIIAIICIVLIFKSNGPHINLEYWKYGIIFGLPIIFQDLSSTILSQADRVMLQKSLGFSLSGIYSLGVAFSHVTAVIYQAINKSWVPFYYEDVSEGKRERIREQAKSSMINMCLIAIGFVMVFREVYRIYASEAYQSGAIVIPVLAYGCFMQYLYYFPVNHELYKSKTMYVASGTICASIINIILNYLLIPHYGMMGAAIATLISYVLLFLFHELIVRINFKEDYFIRPRLNLIAIMVITCAYALYYLLKDFWYVRWGIGACAGALLLYRLIKRRGLF